MSIHSIEGNLQFALLAVQLQFVDRQQCVSLLHEWLRDTTGSLPSLMRDHGVLTDERAGYIEEMLSAPQPRADETASRARRMTWLGPVSEQPAGDDDYPVTDDGRPAGRLLRAVRQPAEAPAEGAAEGAAEGPVLGRFRIVRFHQEGGLGRVSIARDLELDRDVALKEMKDQIADDPLRRDRFVLEAEITGGLEHPSIVPVYGLGYQDDGRPYYAMRLVRGDTLERAIHTFHETDWSQLPPGEKAVQQRRLLGRFLDACHAVHYAHERGVLHRDIKPGNIMLGEYGETLVVDWGLAKAEGDWIRPEHLPQQDESRLLSPRTNTAIEATLMGQTIGTPHFMSPEQAAGDWNQLGPAADVYSLGATLFTVLTNRPPLEGQSVDELLAKARRHEISTPRSIKRDVPRPLEAICLQAMAQFPQDRYRSVRELSDDVERFLADHTVSAYREPVAERMARLARRHRGIVRLAVASLVVFAIGATVAAWQIHRQKLAADDARDVAQASQIRAERVLSYLVRAFRRPDPQLDGRLITVAEVLQQTTHELKRSLADQPRDRAQLLDAIGTSYIGLGLYNDATDVLADAHRLEQDLLGGQHLDTLTTGSRLAEALRGSGRLEEATQLCQQVLQRAGVFLPPNHPLVLATMGRRAECQLAEGHPDQAILLLREALADTTVSDAQGIDLKVTLLGTLAEAYRATHQLEQAIPLLEETFETSREQLGEDHPTTLTAMNNLARGYEMTGATGQALELYERTWQALRTTLGEDHPVTLTVAGNLALAYQDAGRMAESVPLLERIVEVRSRTLSPEHPSRLLATNNLASGYVAVGQFGKAAPMYQDTLEARRATLGPTHPDTLTSMNNLARVWESLGNFEQALPLYEETLKLRRETLGDTHLHTLMSLTNLATGYRSSGQPARAIPLYQSALSAMQAQLGPEHPFSLVVQFNLAEAYVWTQAWDQALPLLLDAWNQRTTVLGPHHPETLKTQFALARAHLLSRQADAMTMANEFVHAFQDVTPHDELLEAEGLILQAEACLQHDAFSRVPAIVTAAGKILAGLDTRRQPNQTGSVAYLETLTGASELAAGQLDSAEQHLRRGYDQLSSQRGEFLPPELRYRLLQTATWLADLYAKWERPDQAEVWRKTADELAH